MSIYETKPEIGLNSADYTVLIERLNAISQNYLGHKHKHIRTDDKGVCWKGTAEGLFMPFFCENMIESSK